VSRKRPASFAELVEIVDEIPAAVKTTRRARGLNLREAAEQSGVSFNALSRIERGGDCSLANLRALLVWLDQSSVGAMGGET
jgi:ribosome-binding protein aMBF1 (putative translation factor)